MNSLLIYEEEIDTPGVAIISGERALNLISEHELFSGLETKVAVKNQGLGSGRIEIIADSIRITYDLNLPVPPRTEIEVIAAVCRPQTMKKIIMLCCYHGVRSLDLVKTSRTEDSYLTSKVLTDVQIGQLTELALQQSFDCYAPRIDLHSNFSRFLAAGRERLNELPGKFLLDTPRIGAWPPAGMSDIPASQQLRVVLALGPEAGWTDDERSDFLKLGFERYFLGPRIYRSETALALAFGRLLQLCHGEQPQAD